MIAMRMDHACAHRGCTIRNVPICRLFARSLVEDPRDNRYGSVYDLCLVHYHELRELQVDNLNGDNLTSVQFYEPRSVVPVTTKVPSSLLYPWYLVDQFTSEVWKSQIGELQRYEQS